MTHTINTLMALAERMAVAMAGNPDACELINARSELHAALTEALGPETWTDDGGWTFEIEKPANPVVKESLSTQVAQPVRERFHGIGGGE